MSKRNIVIIIGLFTVVFLGIGGIIYQRHVATLRDAAKLKPLSSQDNTPSRTDDMSESQLQSTQTTRLSVDNNPESAALGQLNPNQSEELAPRQRSTSMFDPATFSEYEKYKDHSTALYSDALTGTGAELASGMKAAVFYKGWLTDGTMFDMSRTNEKGELQPFIFTMGANEVIPGWEQGLAGMKVGGVRLLIVPPAVGYGSHSQNSIPPNSVLVFQVQLLDVQ